MNKYEERDIWIKNFLNNYKYDPNKTIFKVGDQVWHGYNNGGNIYVFVGVIIDYDECKRALVRDSKLDNWEQYTYEYNLKKCEDCEVCEVRYQCVMDGYFNVCGISNA
jgi:hypothetical protein